MKKKAVFLLLLACFAGAVTTILQILGPVTPVTEPDLQDLLDSPKTAMRMHLYGANRDADGKPVSDKTLGFDYYVDGGRTKFHIHNVFESGASEDIYLRPDGSKKSSFEYFPLGENETLPLLRGRATFDNDGKTFTSHVVYGENGLKLRQGELLDSGLYKQSYFCADGVRIERQRLFDQKKNFQSESIYDCNTGKLSAEVLPGAYSGQVKVKLLRQDGTLKAELVKDYYSTTGKLYGENGKELIAEYKFDYSSSSVRTFYAPEKTSVLWESSFGRTRISFFDENSGKKVLYQEWKERSHDNGEKDYMLIKVTQYSATDGRLVKEITMSDDGKVPVSVTVPLPETVDLNSLTLSEKFEGGMAKLQEFRSKDKLRLVKTLDADGKVVKVMLSIEWQSWNNSEQPLGSEAEIIKLDPELMKMPEPLDPPEFKNLGPDRLYDYESAVSPKNWPSTYSVPVYDHY